MKKLVQLFLFLNLIVFMAGCSIRPVDAPANAFKPAVASELSESKLRVVTWNVEHLAYPIELGCKPRTQAELAALQAYAKGLYADVVGLQEVASMEAVHLLFPADEWQVIMSNRPNSEAYECRGNGFSSTQQKVAFAVRKSLKVVSIEQLTDIALSSPGLRYGLAVSVKHQDQTLDILNLHLKSGCFVDDYSRSESPACQTFAEQVPILDRWIEQREISQSPYMVLGDFNHRISAPYNRLTRTLKINQNGAASTLDITTKDLIGCHPRYPAPIDHIVVGALPTAINATNVVVHPFQDMNEEAMLSDHCAVSVDLLENIPSLSNSVKWLTQSNEYQLITEALYKQATNAILEKTNSSEPWVVVMDIDETILDNSAYQVRLDMTNASYSPQSWDAWVVSSRATLVPGAKAFMESVFAKGGKIALITNRDKERDRYTWENMQALQLPINELNTCLLGRSDADTAAINTSSYLNDKDLRREQISLGTANCFSASKTQRPSWQSPHAILMQIGDNIEDINQVKQQSADAQTLLKRWGDDVFILPNPMYGSWR